MVNPESRVYNAYKLAEAIQDQDEAAIEYYGTEILIDTAVDAAPLGAVFTKLGMAKVGGIIMGLGAKGGDEAMSAALKVADKLPSSFGHTADDLFKNAITPNEYGISPIARAIDKHSSRPDSVYEAVAGSPHVKNIEGQKLVESIMNNPDSVVLSKNTGRFGPVVDIVSPDGRALRFDINGNFVGVLEP
jgi:hypothetical protein